MNDQDNINEETTITGCPSVGVGNLPGGFDGVEPAGSVYKGFEEAAVDAFHMLNEAFIHAPYQREARQMYFKTVIGDLADAMESLVPVDRSARGADTTDVYRTPDAAMDGVIDNLTPEMLANICDRHGLKKRMTHVEYMTVAPGVKLTRFNGTNAVRLVAVRKGIEGNDDKLFEISVDRDEARAEIECDGELMYQIKALGLSDRRVVHAAINVLRSHLHENYRHHRRHKKENHLRAGVLSPAQELAATVAREADDDDLAERIENS